VCTSPWSWGGTRAFLTAASVFARKYPDDGPHLIYLPERPFNSERFIQDVQSLTTSTAAASSGVEGISGADGQPVMTTLKPSVEKDAHGNVQLSGTGRWRRSG